MCSYRLFIVNVGFFLLFFSFWPGHEAKEAVLDLSDSGLLLAPPRLRLRLVLGAGSCGLGAGSCGLGAGSSGPPFGTYIVWRRWLVLILRLRGPRQV